MNITDFTEVPEVPCKLSAIFNRQRELMEKYHLIEEKNGLLLDPAVPVDLHSGKGQGRLKDFAWRVTEELTEATEAVDIHQDAPIHFHEEQIDALHFLVELLILAGIDENKLTEGLIAGTLFSAESMTLGNLEKIFLVVKSCSSGWNREAEINLHTYKVVETLGKAMNCLKQKPWKQSHILTDINKFQGLLIDAFRYFVRLCKFSGLTAEDTFGLYFRKSEVNHFRQESKY